MWCLRPVEYDAGATIIATQKQSMKTQDFLFIRLILAENSGDVESAQASEDMKASFMQSISKDELSKFLKSGQDCSIF